MDYDASFWSFNFLPRFFYLSNVKSSLLIFYLIALKWKQFSLKQSNLLRTKFFFKSFQYVEILPYIVPLILSYEITIPEITADLTFSSMNTIISPFIYNQHLQSTLDNYLYYSLCFKNDSVFSFSAVCTFPINNEIKFNNLPEYSSILSSELSTFLCRSQIFILLQSSKFRIKIFFPLLLPFPIFFH